MLSLASRAILHQVAARSTLRLFRRPGATAREPPLIKDSSWSIRHGMTHGFYRAAPRLSTTRWTFIAVVGSRRSCSLSLLWAMAKMGEGETDDARRTGRGDSRDGHTANALFTDKRHSIRIGLSLFACVLGSQPRVRQQKTVADGSVDAAK